MSVKRALAVCAVCALLVLSPIAVAPSDGQQAAQHAPEVHDAAWEVVKILALLLLGGGGGGYLMLRRLKTDRRDDAAADAVLASQAVVARVHAEIVAGLREEIARLKAEIADLRRRMEAQHAVILRQIREIAELRGQRAPDIDPVTEPRPPMDDITRRINEAAERAP